MEKIDIVASDTRLINYADAVCQLIAEAAKDKGSGLALRTPAYIRKKIAEGKAVIALCNEKPVGFCYIESWGHEHFVANSGLIVSRGFRGKGLAKRIKEKAYKLSRQKFPSAKLFGLTTSLAVMKINSGLGYKPVTYSKLTDDTQFWKGCKDCANYDILVRTKHRNCLCTAMLCEPEKTTSQKRLKPYKVYERWLRYKQHVFFRNLGWKKVS